MNSTQAKTIALSALRKRMVTAAEVARDELAGMSLIHGYTNAVISSALERHGFSDFVLARRMWHGSTCIFEYLLIRKEPDKRLESVVVATMSFLDER
jgi:hypothetical protein